jgi:micrococcal nuclease
MTRAHRNIFLALLLLLVLLFPAVSLAGQYEVYRVVDGDTFVVKHGSVKLTIRMVGFDAPEASTSKHRAGQPFSRQSSQHLSNLILNKTVDVKSYGADRNGRTLGEVFLLSGKNINLEMVQVGLAEAYRGKPASGKDMKPYWKAEEEARAAKRGMWMLEEKYVSPGEWRRTHGN